MTVVVKTLRASWDAAETQTETGEGRTRRRTEEEGEEEWKERALVEWKWGTSEEEGNEWKAEVHPIDGERKLLIGG